MLPRELVLQKSLPLLSHPELRGHYSNDPRGPSHCSTSGRLWYHPYGMGFTGLQNARVVESGRFPPQLPRTAWKIRQGGPERVVRETVGMKLWEQWWPQDIRNTRMWTTWGGKLQAKWSHPNQKTSWAEPVRSQGGATQAIWNSDFTSMWPWRYLWCYRT